MFFTADSFSYTVIYVAVSFCSIWHIFMFVSLCQLRELEPIRLLGLQFLGKLLVDLPSEKKGAKFFSFSVGRSKSISENFKKGENSIIQPIFSAISERLFKFPLSDHLCATLFDVLLGGASPKQVKLLTYMNSLASAI